MMKGEEGSYQGAEHFRKQLLSPGEITLFEVIPPPIRYPPEKIRERAKKVAEILRDLPVDAINLPEVRDESRNGKRVLSFMPKIPPQRFARILRSEVKRMGQPAPECLINRCVVYTHRENQKKWLYRTVVKSGFRSLILVGGESSKIRYPGPSVIQAVQMVRSLPVNPVNLGGITIPTRRAPQSERDEPNRLIEKSRAGIQFFISQILLEVESMKRLIQDYAVVCEKYNVPPCRIFLSFAPVSSPKDLSFLRWLGVEIPDDVAQYLLEKPDETLNRSLRYAQHLWEDFMEWLNAQRFSIPVGINVEHVMSYNLNASAELTKKLCRKGS